MILSAAGAIGLGGVLSAIALFVAAAISSGYALGEPAVVNSILIGGPLLGLMSWAMLEALLYRPKSTDATPPPAPPAASASGSTAIGSAADPVLLEYHGAGHATPRSIIHEMFLFMCGLLLSLPLHLGVLAAATPFRGTAHFTGLGTAWHDNDYIVMPLSALVLAGLGCAIAAVLVRKGAARSLALGIMVGCIALGCLKSMAT